MKILRLVLLPALLTLCMLRAGAAVWQTSRPGYWQVPGTWTGPTVPAYSSADTFIISHPVIFEQSLVFNAGAQIRIEARGGLCGHRNITAHAGANILKYGLLELDTMFIPGGRVLCRLPEQVVFTRYAIITNGGSLVIDSCGLAVGPWFNCRLPEYAFQTPTLSAPSPSQQTIALSPNPGNGVFMLSGLAPGRPASLLITDMTGRAVYASAHGSPGNTWQLKTSLPPGVYNWRLSSAGYPACGGKLVVDMWP